MTNPREFPLITAVKQGDAALVKKLLLQGYDPNESDDDNNETPLKEALRNDAAQIFSLLLSSGADVDVLHNYSSTLEFLFSYEAYHCAKKLLAMGYQLSKTESLELMNSPVTWGSLEALKIVIQSGYNLKINRKPNRLISFAIELSWHQCIEYLLEQGLDPNHCIPDSGPLLIDALYPRSIRTRIVHILLAHGACVRCRGHYKQTPLMLAAQAGSLSLVKKLISSGASCQAKDASGRSALDYADEQGFYALACYLRDKMKRQAFHTRVPTDKLSLFRAQKKSYALLLMDKDLHGKPNGYFAIHKTGSRKTIEKYLHAFIGRVRKGPFLLVQIHHQKTPQFALRHHVHPPTRIRKLQTEDILDLALLISRSRHANKGTSVYERYAICNKRIPQKDGTSQHAATQSLSSISVSLKAILFVDEFGPYESNHCRLKR